jgi:hypothetical protein
VVARWVGEIDACEAKEVVGGRKNHRREKMKQATGEKVAGGKFLPLVDDNGCPPLQVARFPFRPAPPNRPLCSGNGIRAPYTVLDHVGLKKALGRAFGCGETSDASQIV